MFYSMIFMMSAICSTIFSFMIHPLAMGFMLLIQTFLICLLSGILSKSFWFSYILFLIFMGGMLVLFMYVTSLAANEMFNFSMKMFLLNIYILMFFNIMFIFFDKILMLNYFLSNEMMYIIEMKSYMQENSLILNKLYNFPINLVTILLMIYLFLTLIASVKITNIFEGPLRPKF